MIIALLLAIAVTPQPNSIKAAGTIADAALEQSEINVAVRGRLTEHQRWDACVKVKAKQFAAQPETAGVIAEAALGSCLQHETAVKSFAGEVARLAENLSGAALREDVERTMRRWREVQRQIALAIVLEARSVER